MSISSLFSKQEIPGERKHHPGLENKKACFRCAVSDIWEKEEKGENPIRNLDYITIQQECAPS